MATQYFFYIDSEYQVVVSITNLPNNIFIMSKSCETWQMMEICDIVQNTVDTMLSNMSFCMLDTFNQDMDINQ